MKFNGQGPVFGIDIDGTLADYHKHFIRFAEAWTGRSLPDPRDINPAMKFRQFLGLGDKTYRECKLAYRQGGLKRSMPCYVGAKEMTVSLRSSGAEVWICTTRPHLQLGNVDGDTRHWLRRNGIQYDNLIWGERKYIDLATLAAGRVVAILDDLPKMIYQAHDQGLPTVLRDQPYNKHVNEGVDRAYDLPDAHLYLDHLLKKWKATHVGSRV